MWHVRDIFTDFFFSKKIQDIDLQKLSTECFSYFEHEETVKLSNIGGLQSKPIGFNTFPPNSDMEYAKLLHLLQDSLDELSQQFQYKKLNLFNTWININYQNDYNDIHTHPRSSISGVFYVNIPQNCENYLEFFRMTRFDDYFSDVFIGNEHDARHSSKIKVDVQNGLLLAFPSYLYHRTDRNKCNQPRISIAFNADIDV
jgi:uncharacterized protein (TIGR02466 family)